jgi:hypothetical protein
MKTEKGQASIEALISWGISLNTLNLAHPCRRPFLTLTMPPLPARPSAVASDEHADRCRNAAQTAHDAATLSPLSCTSRPTCTCPPRASCRLARRPRTCTPVTLSVPNALSPRRVTPAAHHQSLPTSTSTSQPSPVAVVVEGERAVSVRPAIAPAARVRAMAEPVRALTAFVAIAPVA